VKVSDVKINKEQIKVLFFSLFSCIQLTKPLTFGDVAGGLGKKSFNHGRKKTKLQIKQ